MRRIVLSPRWLVGTLLALLAVAACILAGLWQLHRAESVSGTLQNAGYAVQWPLFAVFFAFLWWRMLRQELAAAREGEPAARDGQPAFASSPPPEPGAPPPETGPPPEPGPSPFTRAPAVPVRQQGPDEVLAAYNRMLAELAASTQRERS